jgi:hypothetical protein
VLAEAAACAALAPAALALAFAPPESVTALLANVDTCPAALRRARDGATAAGSRLVTAALRGTPMLDATAAAALAAHIGLINAQQVLFPNAQNCGGALATTLVLLLGASATQRARAASPNLASLQEALLVAGDARVLKTLRERLANAPSEAAILAAAATAASQLFPDALGAALGAFAEGSACNVIAVLEVSASSSARRAALAAALPLDVSAAAASSVAAVCVEAPDRAALLDSRELAGGVDACSDWAAACAAGLPTARAVTVPLTAGPVIIGFAQLHFGLYADAAVNVPALLSLCDITGGAIFVRRAFALQGDGGSGRAGAGAAAVSPCAAVFECAARSGSDAYPASAEDAGALEVLDACASADRHLLRSWSLDAWALPDDELQRLLVAQFHSLGLLRRFRISPTAFAGFVADVAEHYNGACRMHRAAPRAFGFSSRFPCVPLHHPAADNPFHNVRHAFMVTHAAWLFLADSTLRQRLLEDLDCLALLLAALCHDLEHPGTTNAYHVRALPVRCGNVSTRARLTRRLWQVNTGSPLALRYNDASVLENAHAAAGACACSLRDPNQRLLTEEPR